MHFVVDHPLVRVKLSRMRNRDTDSRDFRFNLQELSQFMAFEVTKDLKTKPFPIVTPMAPAKGYKLSNNVVLIPILRAGIGMVDGFKAMLPQASIGFLGMYRNEKTLQPIDYYCKLPKQTKGADVIIVDPMLATSNSMINAINIIKKHHPKSIRVACVIASPEGIKAFEKAHPNIPLYTCAIDQRLNEHGYIIPGLGDAGDRIFGTK